MDSDLQPLGGAVFSLYTVSNAYIGDTGASSSVTGLATYSGDLALGGYYFVEKTAPDGYISDYTTHYDFTLSDTDYSVENSCLYHVYGSDVVNNPIKVEFTVVNAENHGAGLSDSTFKLYNNILMLGDASYTETSDSNGLVTFSPVTAGTYYMKQTASHTGYRVSDIASWKIVVSADGTSTIQPYLGLLEGYGTPVALTSAYLIENGPIKGSIKLTLVEKADDYAPPPTCPPTYLSGSPVSVYPASGGEITGWYAAMEPITDLLDTDTGYNNAYYNYGLENIPAGEYRRIPTARRTDTL